MLNNNELPYLLYIVVLLPQKRFFEPFWRILSSLFTVPNNRRKKAESTFWKGSSAGPIFPQKIVLLQILNFAAKRSKDSHFFSYLPIKNLSKRPRASRHRKLKSHSFWTVKMRPTDCLFLIGFRWTINAYKVFFNSVTIFPFG